MDDNQYAHVVAHCAQECHWQQSGELSVAWMFEGWRYAAAHRSEWIAVEDILELGRLIEPGKNRNGFRQVGVRVGSSVKMDWSLVSDALNSLVKATPPLNSITEVEAIEWFRQYEEIHPFVDGNGRTGNLLFNWLKGTLEVPVMPPNLWSDPRW